MLGLDANVPVEIWPREGVYVRVHRAYLILSSACETAELLLLPWCLDAALHFAPAADVWTHNALMYRFTSQQWQNMHSQWRLQMNGTWISDWYSMNHVQNCGYPCGSLLAYTTKSELLLCLKKFHFLYQNVSEFNTQTEWLNV